MGFPVAYMTVPYKQEVLQLNDSRQFRHVKRPNAWRQAQKHHIVALVIVKPLL